MDMGRRVIWEGEFKGKNDLIFQNAYTQYPSIQKMKVLSTFRSLFTTNDHWSFNSLYFSYSKIEISSFQISKVAWCPTRRGLLASSFKDSGRILTYDKCCSKTFVYL